jgi:glycosyltransferase involved in cell wall biosynthesis
MGKTDIENGTNQKNDCQNKIKRVFLCANVKFPRGDAGANYIEYMALALREIGYEVYVLANIPGSTAAKDDTLLDYHGIHFVPVPYGKNRRTIALQYLTYGDRFVKVLKRNALTEHDHIMFYSKNPFFIQRIRHYIKSVNCSESVCVVEWHQPFQYRLGRLDPEYLFFKTCFFRLYEKIGNVIAISRLLQQQFQSKGCNVCRIPIMANTNEYPYARTPHEGIRFLLCGTTEAKDKLSAMFASFGGLSDEELNQIQIHIVGMKKSVFDKYMGACKENVKKKIIFHSWMEYDELIRLYRQMDFLLLAREDNIVTRANFPSKIPETMNFGIVPVASRVGDYAEEYLTEENAILIDGCGEEAVCRAVKKALHLSAEELRQYQNNARHTVEAKFDYSNWVQVLNRFLEA